MQFTRVKQEPSCLPYVNEVHIDENCLYGALKDTSLRSAILRKFDAYDHRVHAVWIWVTEII